MRVRVRARIRFRSSVRVTDGEGQAKERPDHDADDGAGGINVAVTSLATVDCTPPLISGVQAGNIEPRSADISFTTNEPASGSVHYGVACDQLTETSTSNTSFKIK